MPGFLDSPVLDWKSLLLPQVRGLLKGLSTPVDLASISQRLPFFQVEGSVLRDGFLPPLSSSQAQSLIEEIVKELMVANPALGSISNKKFIPTRHVQSVASELQAQFARASCVPVSALPSFASSAKSSSNALATAADTLGCSADSLLATSRFVFAKSATEPLASVLQGFGNDSSMAAIRPQLPAAVADPGSEEDAIELLNSLSASLDLGSLSLLTPDSLPTLLNLGDSSSTDPKAKKAAKKEKKRSVAQTSSLLLFPSSLVLASPSFLSTCHRFVESSAKATASEESTKALQSTITASSSSAAKIKSDARDPTQAFTQKSVLQLLQWSLASAVQDKLEDEEEGARFFSELAAAFLPLARDAYREALQALLSEEADRRRELQEEAEANLAASFRRAAACWAGAQTLFGGRPEDESLLTSTDRHLLRVYRGEIVPLFLRAALLSQGMPAAAVEAELSSINVGSCAGALESIASPHLRSLVAEASQAQGGFEAFLTKLEEALKAFGVVVKRPEKKAELTRSAREYELFLVEKVRVLSPLASTSADPGLHAQLLSLLVPLAVASGLKTAVNVPGKALEACISMLRGGAEGAKEEERIAPLEDFHRTVLQALGGDAGARENLAELAKKACSAWL